MHIAFRFLLIFLFAGTAIHGTTPKQIVEEILAQADVRVNGDRPSDIRVYDDRLYARLIADGSLGLGESYMDGWWDAPALDECMCKLLKAKLEAKVKPTWQMAWNYFKAKIFNMQEKGARSTKVIDQHYELGDNLYELMLGDTLAYTCAYWKNAHSLDEAQKQKFDLIAKKVGLKKGMRVLDLGCGWGGFAHHIAKNYGVEVVAVNLSAGQCAYAKKLCAGLPVEVRNHDYREAEGTFDRIISIGLMEHVGAKNYRGFMELIHRCLKDDGLALVHTIGRNESAVTSDPWISKYIFPHGHLPSIAQIGQAAEGLFVMEDWHNIGSNYDTTLLAWYKNFESNWDKIKSNYPEPFYKMWKYYLLSCAGAFRARSIQLWQVVLSKQGVQGGYDSVR
ncbi:MAG TPA: cyclopropane fatty acyl phospholipid synthase [Chlamydiales bacterium]|nr:cyclopropane fatty acyl phospholipid synthase [Chlamydiales bacterium]